LGLFNRFYIPHEPYDAGAADIHGLTPARIAALRLSIPATVHFLEDWPNLLDFWDRFGIAGIVVHNLSYDTSFLPEIAQNAFKWWCSMRGLTGYCAIPKRAGKAGNGFKWPKLEEATDILCNGPRRLSPPPETERIENVLGNLKSHVSLCDCFDLYRVVVRIARHCPEMPNFASHVAPFRAPGKKRTAKSLSVAPLPDRFTRSIIVCERKLRSVMA
jgi:hypothetical protein